jgi:erythromycin esterase
MPRAHRFAVPACLRILPLAALLLAAACSDSSINLPEGPPPPPTFDPEHLLTDAELATEEDPFAPGENPTWAAWAAANVQPVRSLTSSRHDDLQFLKTTIGGRRIVQLGESGHGVREFNLAKVRLIRFLHQEMGFDVIAFESGFFECDLANRRISARTAEETMRGCIFGVWHTHEVRALFDYVKETQGTARPLRLAGFDTQISASTAREAPAFLRDVLAPLDTAWARRAFVLDSTYIDLLYTFIGGAPTLAERAERSREMDALHRLTARYDSLHAFLAAREAQVAAANPADPALAKVARQTVYGRVRYLAQGLADPSSDAAWIARDEGMAANITFLANEQYAGKKVIVWAHNTHIQHDRASVDAERGRPGPEPPSMGHWVAARHRAELYTVGLFMYRGRAAFNGGAPYGILPPVSGSLESILYRTRKKHVFLDLLHQPRGEGNDWMWRQIDARAWGLYAEEQVIRDQYDGILFVHAVNPPNYL